MNKTWTDQRIRWYSPAGLSPAEAENAPGVDEQEYPHERILQQLSVNATNITKLTDRLMIARQMVEEGKELEENERLIPILSEELELCYEDREVLYRIDAVRELLETVREMPRCELPPLPKRE